MAVVRHATKPRACEYGHEEMSGWYRERDLLPTVTEEIITEHMPLDAIGQRVMEDVGLVA